MIVCSKVELFFRMGSFDIQVRILKNSDSKGFNRISQHSNRGVSSRAASLGREGVERRPRGLVPQRGRGAEDSANGLRKSMMLQDDI